MSAYNHVTLVGNLVKDPDTKKVGKKSKTDFTIAVERYAGKDKEPEVDFFNIVSWGKLAEIGGEYLKKGKKVLVDGRVQIRSYEVDKQRRWITEVIAENLKFLSVKQSPATVAE
ncbi:MAG: single-stranded DNA-binding protein [Candidatus Margulisbacteria bacterium]|nr:single-stranded DNA-binding protein [Candidatus Margulisiibacteriota bacterium]